MGESEPNGANPRIWPSHRMLCSRCHGCWSRIAWGTVGVTAAELGRPQKWISSSNCAGPAAPSKPGGCVVIGPRYPQTLAHRPDRRRSQSRPLVARQGRQELRRAASTCGTLLIADVFHAWSGSGTPASDTQARRRVMSA